MPEKAEKVIEAQRFILRDANGRVRAELGEFSGYSVALRLYDGDQKRRLEIVIAENGNVGLQIFDASAAPRVVLGVDRDKPEAVTPALSLIAKGGKGAVELCVASDGSSFLASQKGDKSYRLPLEADPEE
jgi:hypothetical protein